MTLPDDDVLKDPPEEPVVRWMERPPAAYGPTVVVGALTGAFMLGMITTLAAVALGRFMAGDD